MRRTHVGRSTQCAKGTKETKTKLSCACPDSRVESTFSGLSTISIYVHYTYIYIFVAYFLFHTYRLLAGVTELLGLATILPLLICSMTLSTFLAVSFRMLISFENGSISLHSGFP